MFYIKKCLKKIRWNNVRHFCDKLQFVDNKTSVDFHKSSLVFNPCGTRRAIGVSFIMYPLAAATAAKQQNDRYDATDIAVVVATSIAHFRIVVGCCASIAIAAAT